MFVRAWVGARLKTNMAAKEEEIVFKLRNEVEKLRKTDAEVGEIDKKKEILNDTIYCCNIV